MTPLLSTDDDRWPTPARITMALDLAQLYGPQVDIDLGGVEPMVDQWEAGISRPTPAQLAKLAEMTGVQVGFFFLPPPDPIIAIVCQRPGRGRGCHVISPPPDPAPPGPVQERLL